MKSVDTTGSLRVNGSVTIREVAARSKVSTATVSRVLAGLDGAGTAVRDRVFQAARSLNYHPNRLARGLRVRQRKMVGVVIPDLQNPFFTGVVYGVESVLCEAGYTLLLGHSDGLATRERTHLGEFRSEGAAGVVLIPGNAPEADYSSLRTWDTPVVAVDRAPSGIEVDLVATSNRDGARVAIQHLLALGHREIALINGPEGFDVTRDRLAGYREALSAAGVFGRDEWVVSGDFRQAGGQRAMDRLLDLARPPRAVLVANNLMTLGALQAIHERGVRIPDDLAVVGFDDMPWATSLRPPLTAVAQPAEELGRAAAQLLIERLHSPGRLVRQVILPTRLVIRASCGAGRPTAVGPTSTFVPELILTH
ncbi:MAG: LacI family DNA-binding transcriptional regulator [Limisphaerales bacterium]